MIASGAPKTHRWVLLLLCGVLLSVAVWGSNHISGYRDGLNDRYRVRCAALVRSFTGGARSWLALGQRDSLDVAANLLLEAGASGIQIGGSAGVVFEDGSAGLWDTLPIGSWNPGIHERRSVSNEKVVEVVEPLLSAASPVPYGYVRVRFDLAGVSARVRDRAGIVWGGIGLAGVLALGGAFLIRRQGKLESPSGVALASLVSVDQAAKHVRLKDCEIDLPRKQFLLFALLAGESGRVYSDQEILEEIWSDSEYADSQDVKQLVYLLRRRLDRTRDGLGHVIVNVKGFGYRLDIPRDDPGVIQE